MTTTTTRRSMGAGSLRADGTYEIRTMIDGRRRSFYGRTLTEARRKAEDARAEWRPTQGGTVADFLADWIDAGRDTLKPQTWRRYETIVRRQVVPAIGDLQLSKVSEADVRRLQDRLRGKVGDTTRHHVHVVLGTALEEARRRGLIRLNPARGVRAPRVHHREKVPLTEAEARRLLNAAKGDPWEPLFVLALTTGARVGELLALRWKDVDLEGSQITIRGTVVRGFDGKREINDPKTTRGYRIVPIPPMTVAVLAALEARRGGERATGLLFPSASGGVASSTVILRGHFYPLLEKAGLRPMTFHELRDTFATLMLSRETPLHVVSAILGHSSPTTTATIYAHVTRGLEAQATAAVQALFGG